MLKGTTCCGVFKGVRASKGQCIQKRKKSEISACVSTRLEDLRFLSE